ncbi:hypothetical protein IWQ60_009014 [Tieghemiomyces parasiticus]|uniref:Uncharacterized protein n=1 Tax=Tieghemiomyces parasiticus TaxID=78921 RepID=A0A9W8DKL3_9FUNG|nr:hypothetical protein IWQ60_009014 [Tieghemiomyces parasiticus]
MPDDQNDVSPLSFLRRFLRAESSHFEASNSSPDPSDVTTRNRPVSSDQDQGHVSPTTAPGPNSLDTLFTALFNRAVHTVLDGRPQEPPSRHEGTPPASPSPPTALDPHDLFDAFFGEDAVHDIEKYAFTLGSDLLRSILTSLPPDFAAAGRPLESGATQSGTVPPTVGGDQARAGLGGSHALREVILKRPASSPGASGALPVPMNQQQPTHGGGDGGGNDGRWWGDDGIFGSSAFSSFSRSTRTVQNPDGTIEMTTTTRGPDGVTRTETVTTDAEGRVLLHQASSPAALRDDHQGKGPRADIPGPLQFPWHDYGTDNVSGQLFPIVHVRPNEPNAPKAPFFRSDGGGGSGGTPVDKSAILKPRTGQTGRSLADDGNHQSSHEQQQQQLLPPLPPALPVATGSRPDDSAVPLGFTLGSLLFGGDPFFGSDFLRQLVFPEDEALPNMGGPDKNHTEMNREGKWKTFMVEEDPFGLWRQRWATSQPPPQKQQSSGEQPLATAAPQDKPSGGGLTVTSIRTTRHPDGTVEYVRRVRNPDGSEEITSSSSSTPSSGDHHPADDSDTTHEGSNRQTMRSQPSESPNKALDGNDGVATESPIGYVRRLLSSWW